MSLQLKLEIKHNGTGLVRTWKSPMTSLHQLQLLTTGFVRAATAEPGMQVVFGILAPSPDAPEPEMAVATGGPEEEGPPPAPAPDPSGMPRLVAMLDGVIREIAKEPDATEEMLNLALELRSELSGGDS